VPLEPELGVLYRPVTPGTEGKGGDRVDSEYGEIYGSNITPYALGDWTDGEIFRAIVSGVSKGGAALAPQMPYEEFRLMPEGDIHAIIAYLRTVRPIAYDWEESRLH